MTIEPGTAVLVITHVDGALYYTGELVEETERTITIKRATWHRSTGRHHEFIEGADSHEREAYPPELLVRLERPHVRLVVSPWNGNLDAGSQ